MSYRSQKSFMILYLNTFKNQDGLTNHLGEYSLQEEKTNQKYLCLALTK
ncbi:hypothetical protein QE439_002618 [Pedobacter agri]|nr:hypothetical protein [Pedobacter agri]